MRRRAYSSKMQEMLFDFVKCNIPSGGAHSVAATSTYFHARAVAVD